MDLRQYRGSFTTLIIVISTLVLTAVCIIVWLMFASAAKAADSDMPCLTKAQAQAKWPGAWLYWHTANKCWDNRRGGASYTVSRQATWGKQNSLKLPKPNLDPSANVVRHSGRPINIDPPAGPTVAYPTLMTGGGTTDDMMRADSMTGWPIIMDFDADPPQFIPWQQRVAFFVAR